MRYSAPSIQQVRLRNAASLRAKAMPSDPFMYGRSLTEMSHNCSSEGSTYELCQGSLEKAVLAQQAKKRDTERSEMGERIKRHLGLI